LPDEKLALVTNAHVISETQSVHASRSACSVQMKIDDSQYLRREESRGTYCMHLVNAPISFSWDAAKQVPLTPKHKGGYYYTDSGLAFQIESGPKARAAKKYTVWAVKSSGTYRTESCVRKVSIEGIDGSLEVDQVGLRNAQIGKINGVTITDLPAVKNVFFCARLMQVAQRLLVALSSKDKNDEPQIISLLNEFEKMVPTFKFRKKTADLVSREATANLILNKLYRIMPGDYAQSNTVGLSMAQCRLQDDPHAALRDEVMSHKPRVFVQLLGQESIKVSVPLMTKAQQVESLRRIGVTTQTHLPSYGPNWRRAMVAASARSAAGVRTDALIDGARRATLIRARDYTPTLIGRRSDAATVAMGARTADVPEVVSQERHKAARR
jgi:hypothetical protein